MARLRFLVGTKDGNSGFEAQSSSLFDANFHALDQHREVGKAAGAEVDNRARLHSGEAPAAKSSSKDPRSLQFSTNDGVFHVVE